MLRTTPPPGSTLFPYTTLFRSACSRWRRSREDPALLGSPRAAPPLARAAAARAGAPPGRRHGGAVEGARARLRRSEEHTSELQSRQYLVCRLLLEKKNSSHCIS